MKPSEWTRQVSINEHINRKDVLLQISFEVIGVVPFRSPLGAVYEWCKENCEGQYTFYASHLFLSEEEDYVMFVLSDG
jgi:hypothetical protein